MLLMLNELNRCAFVWFVAAWVFPGILLAADDVSSTFDAGDDGWSIVSFPYFYHDPDPAMDLAGYNPLWGNPPGSLRLGDPYYETGIAAPEAYLGDKLAFYGGSLMYDIFITSSDEIAYPAIVLNGGPISIYHMTAPPPVGTWQRRSIHLTERCWRVNGTDELASPELFRSILADLKGLYIATEWHYGDDDTHVDNIRLSQTPAGGVADFDANGHVDNGDLALFASCAAGSSLPYLPECLLSASPGLPVAADFDCDGDVDMNDFGVFQRCYTGPPPVPESPPAASRTEEEKGMSPISDNSVGRR